jgi:hypothetical protein
MADRVDQSNRAQTLGEAKLIKGGHGCDVHVPLLGIVLVILGAIKD